MYYNNTFDNTVITNEKFIIICNKLINGVC